MKIVSTNFQKSVKPIFLSDLKENHPWGWLFFMYIMLMFFPALPARIMIPLTDASQTGE